MLTYAFILVVAFDLATASYVRGVPLATGSKAAAWAIVNAIYAAEDQTLGAVVALAMAFLAAHTTANAITARITKKGDQQ